MLTPPPDQGVKVGGQGWGIKIGESRSRGQGRGAVKVGVMIWGGVNVWGSMPGSRLGSWSGQGRGDKVGVMIGGHKVGGKV